LVRVAVQVEQRGDALVGLEDHVTTAATVAPVRAPAGHVGLPSERHGPVAAAAPADVDRALVDERGRAAAPAAAGGRGPGGVGGGHGGGSLGGGDTARATTRVALVTSGWVRDASGVDRVHVGERAVAGTAEADAAVD